MPAPIVLLKCIGKAVLKAAIKAVPLGDAVLELAIDAYGAWSKETDEESRRAEVQSARPGRNQRSSRPRRRHRSGNRWHRARGYSPDRGELPDTGSHGRSPIPPPACRPDWHQPSAGSRDADRGRPDPAPTHEVAAFQGGRAPLPGVDWELVELLRRSSRSGRRVASPAATLTTWTSSPSGGS